MVERRSRRRTFWRYAGLGTAAFVLLVFAVCITLFENQFRKVADWLLDRPGPVAVPAYERTSAWKSGQEAFHLMESALYGAFMNLQITPDRIRDIEPRTTTDAGRLRPLVRQITVSGSYSSTECNLEVSRAVAGVGGKVVRAEERARTRELLLEIAFDGHVTHRLNITRDPAIKRRTGRLAVVVAYMDGNHRSVVEKLSEFTRPITFALAPWAYGVNDIAAEVTRGNHEVIALLPVQPKSFTRDISSRRSVLPTHSERTNRRIVEEALASLPGARGVLRYPAGHMDDEAAVLAPVLDELARHDRYFLDNPGNPGSSAGMGGAHARLRAWGVLDPVYNPVIISMNLDRASLSALDDTGAIVIADARPHTLQVLMNRMKYLEIRGIEFVRVSDLVDN